MPKESNRIIDLIAFGENISLDFKEEINDPLKIAKTISAFSNTNGGVFLVGVKDNGNIKGIQTDEEQYMMEMAGSLYCQPEVKLKYLEHLIENKTVLEVIVSKSDSIIYAIDAQKNKWIYVREHDKTHKAGLVSLNVLRHKKRQDLVAKFKEEENLVLNFIKKNEKSMIQNIVSETNLKKKIIINSLTNLVFLEIISIFHHNDEEYYKLKI